MASNALTKAPANLSKGEIYSKYMASRRTQMRRRAEATTRNQDMVQAAVVYGAGAAMGAAFQSYPNAERLFRDASGGGGLDTKLAVGITATILGLYTRGNTAAVSTATGHAALALAGADMGRSMVVDG